MRIGQEGYDVRAPPRRNGHLGTRTRKVALIVDRWGILGVVCPHGILELFPSRATPVFGVSLRCKIPDRTGLWRWDCNERRRLGSC